MLVVKTLPVVDLTEDDPPLVYLSGPISKGNRTSHFARACEAQDRLMRAGYAVVNPMLTMMHPNAYNITHDTWLRTDRAIVRKCDYLVRLPGESAGADDEVETAINNDVVVVPAHNVPCLRDLLPAISLCDYGILTIVPSPENYFESASIEPSRT